MDAEKVWDVVCKFSKSELQEKKKTSNWNYRIILAKTKNELPPEIEKRNPPVRGSALDQPSSRTEVRILKCFCSGHWAGLGEYKSDLAWQSWHFFLVDPQHLFSSVFPHSSQHTLPGHSVPRKYRSSGSLEQILKVLKLYYLKAS